MAWTKNSSVVKLIHQLEIADQPALSTSRDRRDSLRLRGGGGGGELVT